MSSLKSKFFKISRTLFAKVVESAYTRENIFFFSYQLLPFFIKTATFFLFAHYKPRISGLTERSFHPPHRHPNITYREVSLMKHFFTFVLGIVLILLSSCNQTTQPVTPSSNVETSAQENSEVLKLDTLNFYPGEASVDTSCK